MDHSRVSPGPDAHRTFRAGTRAAVVGGLAVLWAFYWFDVVSLVVAVFLGVCLFPPYLLVVAVVLSKWLGFDKDWTDLRRVTRAKQTERSGEP